MHSDARRTPPVEADEHPAEHFRRSLAIGIAFMIAASAILGGGLLAIQPSGRLLGLSTARLDGTPFRSYLVPGLVLMLAVGGMATIAAVAQLRRALYRQVLTLFAGFTLMVWMVAQIIMLGWFHPMQPLLVAAALALVLIGLSGLIAKGVWSEAVP